MTDENERLTQQLQAAEAESNCWKSQLEKLKTLSAQLLSERDTALKQLDELAQHEQSELQREKNALESERNALESEQSASA